jgi:hypothetical protein
VAREGGFNFKFEVNQSFLKSRALTIKKVGKPYLDGILQPKNSCDISVISIDGTSIKANLYYGISGLKFGGSFYYQIRISENDFIRSKLNTLEIGKVLLVEFNGNKDKPEFGLKLMY